MRASAPSLCRPRRLQESPPCRLIRYRFETLLQVLSRLDDAARRRGVAAFSSGNRAQGVALAAQLLEAPAVIVMPRDAPAVKLEATRGYGAEVVLYERAEESREAIARRLCEERGLTLVPPFDHPHIVAGQGTAGLELCDEVRDLDVLVAPIGGGGLLAGCSLAARAGGRSRRTRSRTGSSRRRPARSPSRSCGSTSRAWRS